MSKTIPAQDLREHRRHYLDSRRQQRTGSRDGRRQPGAGQPERPRLARRRHGAALCRRGARRRAEAQRRRRRSARHRHAAALDGRRGYGQVVGVQAMALGIERAPAARQLHHDAGAGAPPGPHRALRRDGGGAGPGVDALRQRAVAAGGGAMGRRRRPLRHQPVLHRRAAGRAPSPSCSTSPPAAWRRARCAWPTTRASACRRAT